MQQSADVHFENPASFQCEVMGKEYTATIISESFDPIYYCFNIQFNNGVQLRAMSDEDNGWVTENLYPNYLNAIKPFLDDFHSVYKDPYLKFDLDYYDRKMTAWIAIKKGEEGTFYQIYFDGDYQFNVRKDEGKWFYKTVRVIDPNPIDEELALLIVGEIEKSGKRPNTMKVAYAA